MSREFTEDDRVIAENFLALRMERGLSQEALADELGVTFQMVQRYEKGKARLSGGQIMKAAAAFDVSVSALFSEETASNANARRAVDDFMQVKRQVEKMHSRLTAILEILDGRP